LALHVVVAGTRPEIIKVAPIIRELLRRKKRLYFIHTGQHYDFSLSRQMILDLKLPEPNMSFQLKSSSPASQIAEIMKNLEGVLTRRLSKILVIVQGDTNSVLSASLAAVKCGAPLAHIEAGLRSFDWRMPEEHNRRMVDHISNYLFAPTKLSMQNLQMEKVFGRVYMTGNTIIDAVNQHIPIAEKKYSIKQLIPFTEYAIATFHRSENVDDRKVLTNIVNGLLKSELPIIIPIHPRTKKMLRHFDLQQKLLNAKNIHLTNPLCYLEFLLLMKGSRLIITDSGGIQQESTAPAICKRVLVLRHTTERQEAVEAGFAKLINLKAQEITREIRNLWFKKAQRRFKSPYGDGSSSRRIIDILNKMVN
jgi:UDP-N-acetylglucosamine 2-epimerase (non-hydrolysing)